MIRPIIVQKSGCSPVVVLHQPKKIESKSLKAPVLKTKLIHIGITKSMTKTQFLLYLGLARIQAKGKLINKHKAVFNRPIRMDTKRTFNFVVEVNKEVKA